MTIKMNCRQLVVLAFLSLLSMKYLGLPALLFQTSGRDSYLVLTFVMIVDILLMWLIIKVIKSSGEKNFYEFLKHRFGVVVSKIILILSLFAFILKMAITSKSMELFVLENLYDEFHWLLFIIPLTLVVGYMVYKGIRNIARVSELFVWLFVIGTFLMIVKIMPIIDFSFMLPFMENGLKPLIESSYKHVSWFGTSNILFFFIGFVNFSDKKTSRFWFYMIIGLFLTNFLFIAFYGVYQITSATHSFALSDVSQISSKNIALDELSWLIVGLWVIAQTLQLCIFTFCASFCMKYIFNIRNNYMPILISIALLIVWVYVDSKVIGSEKFFLNIVVVIYQIITQYVFIIIILLVDLIYRKRKLKKEHQDVKV